MVSSSIYEFFYHGVFAWFLVGVAVIAIPLFISLGKAFSGKDNK